MTRWHAVEDSVALAQRAAARILAAASEAIDARSCFRIVLAGGETPLPAYALLRHARAAWAHWNVYYSDERCLPATDPGRNSRAIAAAWLDHVAIPPAQHHVIPAELGPRAGADAYSRVLADVGEFDLVLLGLGADGHTASLFPGRRDLLDAPGAPAAIAVTDAPRPPAQRVTLTPARLSRARGVMFLVDGGAKRAAIEDWRSGRDVVARSIRPAGGVDVLYANESNEATGAGARDNEVASGNRLR